MSSTITPNMGLTIPTVSNQPGPQYAVDVNASLTLIDSHNHTPGSGVQITPSGLDINTDLDFGNNNITGVRSTRYTTQGSPLSLPNDLDCIYVSGVDLYYNDGNGNQVRITQGGGVAGSPGSITNLNPPASASYNSGSSTFIWQSDVNKPANMDMASAIIRNLTTGSNGVTLQAGAALASNYALTLPLLPASQKFMTLDAAGLMSAPWAVDGSTIVVASNVVKVPDQGITANQIQDHSIDLLELATTVLQWNKSSQIINVPSFNVRVATTVNGTLATAFDNGSVVDGVTLATSDIILLKNQTAASDNGVYNVQASGAPVRNVSYDTFTELNYAGVHVTAGTVNANSDWFQNSILTSLSDSQVWSHSSTQTFTVPANVNAIIFVGCGGGGGGGSGALQVASGASPQGGSGGSGSIPTILKKTVTPGQVLTFQIGAGGAGAPQRTGGSSVGVAGSDGSDTTVSGTGISMIFKGSIGGAGGISSTISATGNTETWQAAGSYTSSGGGGGGGNNVISKVGAAGGVNSWYATASTGGAAINSATNPTGGGGGGGGAGLAAGGNGGNGGSNVTLEQAGGDAAVGSGGGGGGSGGYGKNTNTNDTLSKGGNGGSGIVEMYWLGAAS